MKNDFINLTEENVSDEHLCCIIRSRKPHSGISAKREWLSDRLKEGHVDVYKRQPLRKCTTHMFRNWKNKVRENHGWNSYRKSWCIL